MGSAFTKLQAEDPSKSILDDERFSLYCQKRCIKQYSNLSRLDSLDLEVRPISVAIGNPKSEKVKNQVRIFNCIHGKEVYKDVCDNVNLPRVLKDYENKEEKAFRQMNHSCPSCYSLGSVRKNCTSCIAKLTKIARRRGNVTRRCVIQMV
jgi:hypothetical protein